MGILCTGFITALKIWLQGYGESLMSLQQKFNLQYFLLEFVEYKKVFFLKKENILASLEKCVKMQIPILIFRMIKEYLFESGTTSFLLLIVSVYSRRREFSSFFRTRCHVKALLTLTFLYISRICAGCRFQKSNSEVL